MNIKLKALLIAVSLVSIPFIVVTILIYYPLLLAVAGIILTIFYLYLNILDNLQKKEKKA